MEATIEIAGREMIVEYDIKITAHGNNGTAPSLSYPGDPPEPCEFEVDVLGIDFPKRDADVLQPELPRWLADIIATHLSERDDIYQVADEIDRDRCETDPDLEYEARRDERP